MTENSKIKEKKKVSFNERVNNNIGESSNLGSLDSLHREHYNYRSNPLKESFFSKDRNSTHITDIQTPEETKEAYIQQKIETKIAEENLEPWNPEYAGVTSERFEKPIREKCDKKTKQNNANCIISGGKKTHHMKINKKSIKSIKGKKSKKSKKISKNITRKYRK